MAVRTILIGVLPALAIAIAIPAAVRGQERTLVLDPGNWRAVAQVDARFLSYNIEMAEVTGGEFWAPYDDPQRRRLAPRSPLDLGDQRLARLASGLSPAIVRVSGTWANSVYVPKLKGRESGTAPAGFRQVLTRKRWSEVTRLVRDTGGALLLSFPASEGARDRLGRWNNEQARRLVALTRANRTPIRALEFINEPNLVRLGALPEGYSAKAYARDFRTFASFARRYVPEALVLGHSASGKGGELPPDQIAREAAGVADAVSYHFYGALSERCAEFGNQTAAGDALSQGWLERTQADHDWYAVLRDRYDPGKPLWLTETAQAACGGDRWAATWSDSFRFVDQLGRLARAGVQVVAHNTLASGDYALIDRATMTPRPNYWVAWLWKRKMGRIVLAPASLGSGMAIHAHCHAAQRGWVTVVVLELAGSRRSIAAPPGALVTTVTAPGLDSTYVSINGRASDLTNLGRLPGGPVIEIPPHSISFIEFPRSNNPACVRL